MPGQFNPFNPAGGLGPGQGFLSRGLSFGAGPNGGLGPVPNLETMYGTVAPGTVGGWAAGMQMPQYTPSQTGTSGPLSTAGATQLRAPVGTGVYSQSGAQPGAFFGGPGAGAPNAALAQLQQLTGSQLQSHAGEGVSNWGTVANNNSGGFGNVNPPDGTPPPAGTPPGNQTPPPTNQPPPPQGGRQILPWDSLSEAQKSQAVAYWNASGGASAVGPFKEWYEAGKSPQYAAPFVPGAVTDQIPSVNATGVQNILGFPIGNSKSIDSVLPQVLGFDTSSAENKALIPLLSAAREREGLLGRSEGMISNAMNQYLGLGAQSGYANLIGDVANRPVTAFTPENEAGQIAASRRRFADAASGARSSYSDSLASAGLFGGESSAVKSGVDFRSAALLADEINNIHNQFGQGRANERLASAGAAGQGLQNIMGTSLAPQLGYAESIANRTNPEQQAALNLLSLIAGGGSIKTNPSALGGILAGAGTGAAAGSVIPGWGTAAGALIGGVAGAFA